jgi:hypothetical protein
MELQRRQVLALLASGVVLLGVRESWAGSYLDRVSLLISASTRDNEFLSRRLSDRELARLVSQVAAGRLQAAKDTQVPKEVVVAHPHLLLMLEHYERAAAAAAAGEAKRYGDLVRSAQEEEQLFRGLLRQLGWTVPAAK